MILEFEYTSQSAPGFSPQAVHMMDNSFVIVYTDETGIVKGQVAKPEYGLYDSLSWKENKRMSPDDGVSYPSMKKIAHYGVYGFWSASAYENGSSGDHRFIMYMLPTDISHTFIDGNLNYTKDSAVSSASFNFMNANGFLLRRYRSLVSPNAKIELYLSMGSSDEISLGKWYIDRVSTSIPGNNISVTARNTIGKLLKEQTFDENNTFTEPTLTDNLKAILGYAAVEDFFVGDTSKSWKLSFKAEETLLDGIENIIQLLPGFKLDETSYGVVGIGHISDSRFEQPSTYEFERDKNCWSYSTEYSDEQTFSRVCVICNEPSNTLYVDLPPHKLWPMPSHRTLYITVPDGTSQSELLTYASNLSESIAISGRVETFAGRFTPQMIIGDAIRMIADGNIELIGTVTSIRHTLGRKGFYTEFTVDSGGRKGKPMMKDYVSQISGGKTAGNVVIMS
ncbi:MAG: hypothetical protein A2Y17_01115 [Clostridiales bacterium GWF2_38_85]|nr:MAG: hypothetical protein A2Y17_01115 [Clostridiales bacterium GWF2_38_85]